MNIHPAAHYVAKLLDRSSTLSIKLPCNTDSTCVCVCVCVFVCACACQLDVQWIRKSVYKYSHYTPWVRQPATSWENGCRRRQAQLIKLSSETPTKLDSPAFASLPPSLCLKRQMSQIFGHHFETSKEWSIESSTKVHCVLNNQVCPGISMSRKLRIK